MKATPTQDYDHLPQILEPRQFWFDAHETTIVVYETHHNKQFRIPDWHLTELLWFGDAADPRYEAVLHDPVSGGKIRMRLSRDQVTTAVLIYNEVQNRVMRKRYREFSADFWSGDGRGWSP